LSEQHDGGGAPGAPNEATDGEPNRSADQAQSAADAQPAADAAAATPAAAPELSREELERKVAQLQAMLEESMSRARDTQERLKDTHDRLLRLAAEFDNFKKRAAKERDDLQKFGIERLLKDFLPVADNLERALDHAEEHDLRQVIEGVKLVQKLLENTLAKHGVTGFSALGQPFDPNLHEALMQQESDAPPGTVVSEMSRGYKLNERLVRPAAVVVARPKTPPRGGPDGAPPADPK
jgi:molecular chaperone GrpE